MTSPAERRPTVTVVGAGPAGLAAAVQAARSGLDTTLVDAGARIGGQYWRHGPGGPGVDAGLHHDVAGYAALAAALDQLGAQGRLVHLASHDVWAVETDPPGPAPAGCRVYALDRGEPTEPVEVTVVSDYLVLAAGAYDRQVPFPGWELPGVMTVGAAQSLLKGSGVVVGPRVLVAGTGPFLLPVATGLAGRGATVVGVHEASHPVRWLRHLPALAAQPGRLVEATGYAAALARSRIGVHHRSVVVAAHGTDRLEAVTTAALDRSGAVRPGTQRRTPVDVLTIGHGFTAQSELARAVGCRLEPTADQTLAVVVNEEQATANPRVFAAGEITGVGGAQLAVVEGTLAGAAVARAAGLPVHGPSSVDVSDRRLIELARRRGRLRRFAAAMHAVYPVPPSWLEHLRPDTIVCRCEEVTVADIDRAVVLGARDARTAKLLSRSGMGWCQGRECAYATACLVADRTGSPPDLTGGADRPVATPVPLGVLATAAPPFTATPVTARPPEEQS